MVFTALVLNKKRLLIVLKNLHFVFLKLPFQNKRKVTSLILFQTFLPLFFGLMAQLAFTFLTFLCKSILKFSFWLSSSIPRQSHFTPGKLESEYANFIKMSLVPSALWNLMHKQPCIAVYVFNFLSLFL